MEIGPITGVRNLLAVTPRSPDLEPPSIFEIESTAAAGDEADSPGRNRQPKKPRRKEFEDDEFTLTGDGAGAEFSMAAVEPDGRSRISIFA
jgi:hypothetical protein